jgi:hypothetical protein
MSSMPTSATIPSPRAISAWGPSAILAAGILLSISAIAGTPAIAGPPATAAAQAPAQAQSPATATGKKSPRHRARPAAVEPPVQAEPPAPEPAQPEPPKWPVNDTPNKPSVTWDSSGLKIDANNSSLHAILKEVSADTGAKVEGLGADERVFGAYGPGTARDVLSQLLHGSSYNVLMIGDQGAGTPRQIVLSARRTGNSPQQANRPGPEEEQGEEDIPDQPDDNDQSGQPPIINNGQPPMPIVPPPGAPPGAPRTPQQVLQELQQRQQQMQDLQQQQQQQQPQPQQQPQ